MPAVTVFDCGEAMLELAEFIARELALRPAAMVRIYRDAEYNECWVRIYDDKASIIVHLDGTVSGMLL